MFNNITVDEAISRGHKMVTYPIKFIMFGIIALTIWAGMRENASIWTWVTGICSTIILPWIFWSFRITKWRIWAFENVRNVHELNKRAIQEKLIWQGSSIFNKTEIWSREDKQKWEGLCDKFLKDDEVVYETDLTVPEEKIIYYSKNKTRIRVAVMLGFLAFGIYLFLKETNISLGIFFSLTGVYFAFKDFKKTKNKAPQIIINDRGIETGTTKFYPWHEITNEEISIGSGRSAQRYLRYDHPGGNELLCIDDYDIEYKELKRLLNIYKGRSLSKNKSGINTPDAGIPA